MDGSTSSRTVSPRISDFESLRQPLTKGELLTFKFLHNNLPLSWEIYVQPHMNGLCPDFVLVNPHVGIVIIEVKDWNLSAMDYSWENARGTSVSTSLMASKDGKKFRIENPIDKLNLYKDELLNLYCPNLGLQFKDAHYAPVITTALVLANETSSNARRFMEPYFSTVNLNKESQQHYYPIIGIDILKGSDPMAFAIEFERTKSQYMRPEYAEDLRYWLIETRSKEEQRKPLPLNARQSALSKSRTNTGYRRIRGSAGSGKSVVLASRGANLALEEKKVLILTFNITLTNYIADLAVRAALPKTGIRKRITFLNYHRWAKRICYRTGNADLYKNLFKTDNSSNVLNEGLANLVSEILEDNEDQSLLYDAILVDEGQDFRLPWWSSLRKCTLSSGELLLVSDKTQDLYDTAEAWTDEAMLGAGFSGTWVELKETYRLPEDYLSKVTDFLNRFIAPEGRIDPLPIQSELNTQQTHCRWLQISPVDEVLSCVDAVLEMPLSVKNSETLVYPDIVLMANDNATGYQIVRQLGLKGIKVKHTFGDGHPNTENSVSRKQKMSFYQGSEQVKATTIHSFKGWESTCIVVHISRAKTHADFAAIYAALTRLKRSEMGYDSYITVVCSAPELEPYGKSWR